MGSLGKSSLASRSLSPNPVGDLIGSI